jgi:hypothetical protein
MPNHNPNIVSLIESSVRNFNAGAVEAVPTDYPNRQPVRFEPYLVPDGVFYAMEEAKIDPLQNPEMMGLLTDIVRIWIKDCQRKENMRRRVADELNEKGRLDG